MAADVRVRLSAEGQAEVVEAFRKIAAESQNAMRKGGGEAKAFNQVLGVSKELLRAIGVATSIALVATQLRDMAVAGAENASELVNQAQAAGVTQQQYSALAAGARLAGVDTNQFGSALGFFDENLEGLRRGLPDASEKFQRLGLTVADFKGRDAAESMALVAQRISQMEDGAAKTTALRDLFGGKSGARMASFLNQLGREGLPATIQQFKAFGIVLDDKVVGAAARMGDELGIVQLQAKSMATQFAAGLSPAIDALFQNLSKDLGESMPTWRLFGQVVGTVLAAVVGGLTLVVDTAVSLFLVVSKGVGEIAFVTADFVSGQWEKAREEARTGIADIGKMVSDYAARQKQLFSTKIDFNAGAERAQSGTGTAGDASIRAKQQLAAAQLIAQGDLTRTQAANRLLLEAQQSLYERGLSSLEQYYAARRRVIDSNLQAELALLRARRDAELAQPETPQKAANLANIQKDMAAKQAEAAASKKQLDVDQGVTQETLYKQQVNYESQILEAQGKRHEAERNSLSIATDEYKKLLRQEGLSAEQALVEVNRYRDALSKPIEFNAKVDEFSQAFDELDRSRKNVQSDVDAGLISEREGRRRILELERESLSVLQQRAQAALEAAKATNDPKAIAQAEQLVDSLRNLGTETTDYQRRLVNFGDDAKQVLVDQIGNALEDSETRFRTFGDAVLSTIGEIIKALQRLAAQIIAARILQLITGKNPLANVTLFAGAHFAGGGWISGPGTSTSDSVPINASHGEFMVQAKVARRAGSVLEWMNFHATPEQLNDLVRGIQAYQMDFVPYSVPILGDGASEGSQAGITSLPDRLGAAPNGKTSEAKLSGGISIELGEGLIAKHLDSGKLDEAIIRVIHRNPRTVRRLVNGR